MKVSSGLEVLSGYLEASDAVVRALDLEGFRRFIAERIEDARTDEVFVQRRRIAELVRAHRRSFSARTTALRHAREAYAASPNAERFAALEREIESAGKGVAGLAGALSGGRSPDPDATRRKLEDFRGRHRALRAERIALLESTPERERLLRAEAAFERFREEIGLVEEERRLERILHQRGRRASEKGSRFEDAAGEVITRHVLPLLGSPRGRFAQLERVTLGCARAELDHLVVDVPPGGGPVDVLAVVEVKRNPNDLADGFLVRQENLAWFTGEADLYDPERYRTQVYRSGHFDRQAVHEEEGEAFAFDRSSFRRYARDPGTGRYLDGLWFVIDPRPLLGVTSDERARILHRVATDPSFELSRDASVRDLRRWVRGMIGEVQTRDVLALYARSDQLARQILFVHRGP